MTAVPGDPSRIPLLDDCEFYTTAVTDGDGFIGRVKEFPDLRTRPHKRGLDALDDIMTRTAAKLAQLDAAADRQKPKK
ncbi:hypothetical protein A5722_31005 [Mycobacterium vulneris]|nr:hypothetical protein A5721_27905 [Mycolicibacterium vulneris]OCB51638.1 hypothetical protein A5722_31005 [Mycolicibacterium vulneris]OCB64576.1 hypothetical protein A5729_19960 [Mycolicibacterium vulneris]